MQDLQPTNASTLAIGEVAAACGLSVEAIRYYERLGLLPKTRRSSAHRRQFDSAVLGRLAFIGQAKALGLSLAQIRQIVVGAAKADGCRDVHRALLSHLEEIDRKVESLIALRATLRQYERSCAKALQTQERPQCPTLEVMERSAPSREALQAKRRARAR